MNFDYTYISLFGFKLFEPVTILTNLFLGLFCVYAFLKMSAFSHSIVRYWGMFFLLIGLSSTLGSVSHGVHEQLGQTFLNVSWFLMNAVSLISIYFFYRAAFTYFNLGKAESKKIYNVIVVMWIVLLLLFTLFLNNFLLIKIHAGIVLLYSLVVHLITYRNKHLGSGYIVSGILVSFMSIVVHSLKLSFGEWFNYKDISHVIMLLSLVLIYKGVRLKIHPELIALEPDRLENVA